IKGFLSTDNSVPTGTVAADGAGGSTLWDNKTPQQILRDMNAAASAIRENTKGVEFANTLLIPEHHYEIVANTPYSDVSERTILNWFLTNNIWVKQVVPVNELTAANNPFAKDLMVAYNKNPAKVRLNIPSDFEQFNPQEEGLEYVIYCQARCAGVQWYKPFSAIILDGI
ncbi:DUF2184 domain-containing protein, partial [Candidatus Woesearchaeota archaeon]|nr:DUF2184 domain-containing protein [Candidatus Woesearchaeota archaeon]